MTATINQIKSIDQTKPIRKAGISSCIILPTAASFLLGIQSGCHYGAANGFQMHHSRNQSLALNRQCAMPAVTQMLDRSLLNVDNLPYSLSGIGCKNRLGLIKINKVNHEAPSEVGFLFYAPKHLNNYATIHLTQTGVTLYDNKGAVMEINNLIEVDGRLLDWLSKEILYDVNQNEAQNEAQIAVTIDRQIFGLSDYGITSTTAF